VRRSDSLLDPLFSLSDELAVSVSVLVPRIPVVIHRSFSFEDYRGRLLHRRLFAARFVSGDRSTDLADAVLDHAGLSENVAPILVQADRVRAALGGANGPCEDASVVAFRTVLEAFDDADLEVSRASAEDAARIAALLRSAYAAHLAAGLNFSAATATAAYVRSRIRRHDVYVLRQAGMIIGTVTLRTKDDERGIAGYVSQLAVDPGLQRAGFGGTLLARAEREALTRGLVRMRLDTAKPAQDLIGWYERRGYHAVSEVHWEGKTYGSIVMEKDLPKLAD